MIKFGRHWRSQSRSLNFPLAIFYKPSVLRPMFIGSHIHSQFTSRPLTLDDIWRSNLCHATYAYIRHRITKVLWNAYSKSYGFSLYLKTYDIVWHWKVISRSTRQSEMANTSPATCQCLATFTPLKSIGATQEVPMKSIWKKLSVQFF